MTCSRVTQFQETKKLDQFEKVELHEAIGQFRILTIGLDLA